MDRNAVRMVLVQYRVHCCLVEEIKRHCVGSKCCIKIRSRKIGISSKEWFEARVPTFEEHPCECVGKESVCFGNEGGGERVW